MTRRRLKILLAQGLFGAVFVLSLSTARPVILTPQDGPVSVTYGDVYQRGTLKIGPYDLATLPPLPRGYSAVDQKGYLITTSAVVSGPHIIRFSVASITDEKEFRNLRIFHAEPDTFDPDSPAWFDTTIAPPETPAPDFSNKTIHSSSDHLGVFVIARLVQHVPTGVADLAVTCTGPSESVTSPNHVTYVVKVVNNGPDLATHVGLINSLSPDGTLVSATASQGTCKERAGHVYCKLGTLAVKDSATLKVVMKPYEGTTSFPAEGKPVANSVWIEAEETDGNRENNSAIETTLLFPDPNTPPGITIDYPKSGALFVGPADITIKATAFDSDGTVANVEFFDNGELIGSGTPSGDNRLTIVKRNVSFGRHSIIAVATDNQGRQNVSTPADVVVNGLATVKILNPLEGSLIAPGSDVTIAAHVTHPSGLINKVEFFANSQRLGDAALVGPGRYGFKQAKIQAGLYWIIAVATDGSGITTMSAPVAITVTKPPMVSIVNPSAGTLFPHLTNINITAKATDPDGSIKQVDFYANGRLIGSASDISTETFMMTWRRLESGIHTLTAIATDELGITSKSDPVKITVSSPDPKH